MMMMCHRRRFSLLFSSLIVYCIISIGNNNNNVNIVGVNAEEDNENKNDDNDDDNENDGGSIFMNDEILSCIDSTIAFFMDNPEIENECDMYADTYAQTDNGQDINGNNIMELGYPDESLTALESICTNNDGYWISTTPTQKLEFTCLVMEIETIKVIVNNYGECLAGTVECRNTNISMLMEGMFADMDFACYEGDTPPDNFNEIVNEIDQEYFGDDDIFGPDGDDDDLFAAGEDDDDDAFDEEEDDMFALGEDDLYNVDDDDDTEMEEENEEENEAIAKTSTTPATSTSTAKTPPVEESSPTLYGGGESGLDSSNTNGLLALDKDGGGIGSTNSYIMAGIVISCIVIVVGVITHSATNKRGRGGGGGGGGHARLSQHIGYEMTDISNDNIRFEARTLT
jgi:hypothetical protein